MQFSPFWKFEDKYRVHLNRVTYQHGNYLTQQQPVPIFPGDEANVNSKEKIVVDSGTLGFWLPDYIFYPLLRKIEADICLTRVLFDDNPNAYCYIRDMADVEQVSVTLGFVGGAEMLLFGDSLFCEYNGNLICLGLLRTIRQFKEYMPSVILTWGLIYLKEREQLIKLVVVCRFCCALV